VVCAKAAGDDAIAAKAQAVTSETDKPNLTINLILKARFPEVAKLKDVAKHDCGRATASMPPPPAQTNGCDEITIWNKAAFGRR
jgi:hypothetical protein